MGPPVLEPESVTAGSTKELQKTQITSAAESGADAHKTASIDEQDGNLAAIIAAWPGLSTEVRDAIRTIIGCCKDAGAGSEERHLP